MSFSIFFFAVNSNELLRTITTDGELIPRVLSHISRNASPSTADVELLESLLSNGIQGNWPAKDSPDTFTAFCWLLEVTGEPIVIGNLLGFRSWEYWEDVKLWEYFVKVPPPLPVPTAPGLFPVVGFLPSKTVSLAFLSEVSEGASASQEVRAVRTEVLEIIESVHRDNLDLFAIAMC
jgi:hypothetical protein